MRRMVARILVIEDDRVIADSMAAALTDDGYTTRTAGSLREARQLADEWQPDIALVDLGLPDGDGLVLCRQLRNRSPQLRIVIVTAQDDDIDIVVGLDAGANDYVTKPFALPVLRARVRAQLRPVAADPSAPLSIGSLTIDPGAHRATVAGEVLELRPREFALLELLARDRGRVVTHRRILTELWGSERDRLGRKSLETHMHTLRRKLGDGPGKPSITTVRGIGYRFDEP